MRLLEHTNRDYEQSLILHTTLLKYSLSQVRLGNVTDNVTRLILQINNSLHRHVLNVNLNIVKCVIRHLQRKNLSHTFSKLSSPASESCS